MDSFDLDMAHSEGYIAADNGEPASANPYPEGHFCHGAWLDGWADDRLDVQFEYGPQFWLAMFSIALLMATIGLASWFILSQWGI